MARILLIANLNCDHVFKLTTPLSHGRRHTYHDLGRRLGGGGANTGIGLAWNHHQVSLIAQLGHDEIGDWVIAKASQEGINCQYIQRYEGHTPEVLLLNDPEGDRTLFRPKRPRFTLPEIPDFKLWDALYINTDAQNLCTWAEAAIDDVIVVSQMKHTTAQPVCHYLIGSRSDIKEDIEDYWSFASQSAGNHLKAFILTNAAEDVYCYTQEGEFRVASQTVEQVVDSTGAGDCFAAGFIDAILQGKPLKEAVIQGNLWATTTLSHESSIPHPDLKALLKRE